MRLNDGTRAAVIEYVESAPWGDVEGALAVVDEALRLAIAMTRDDFLRWEERFEDTADEFLLAQRVGDLAPEDRLALLARLIRSAALCYGVTTEFSGRPGEICHAPDHAAAPVRFLLSLTSPDARVPLPGVGLRE